MFMERVISSRGHQDAYEMMLGKLTPSNTGGDFGGGDWEAHQERRYLHNWRRRELIERNAFSESFADKLLEGLERAGLKGAK
jgi:hypothetical protein